MAGAMVAVAKEVAMAEAATGEAKAVAARVEVRAGVMVAAAREAVRAEEVTVVALAVARAVEVRAGALAVAMVVEATVAVVTVAVATGEARRIPALCRQSHRCNHIDSCQWYWCR